MLLGASQLGAAQLGGDYVTKGDMLMTFTETVVVTETVVKELQITLLESVVVGEIVLKERELLFTEEVVVSEFIQNVINGGSMTWVPIAKTSTTWTPLPRN